MSTQFESIEAVIKRGKDIKINLMIFDPGDCCYHTYLSQDVKNLTDQDLNKLTRKYENKPKKFKNWVNEWVEENISAYQANNPREKFKVTFSALPSKEDWDVNGFYHTIFYDKNLSKFNIENINEYTKVTLWKYYPDKNNDKDAEISCFSKNAVSSENGDLINRMKYIMLIQNPEYYSIYEDIYVSIRRKLFEVNLEKFISVPIFIYNIFYGIAFVAVSDDENADKITEKMGKLESALPLIKSAIQNIFITEFDKRVWGQVEEFRLFEDIVHAFCENINYLIRCERLECKLSYRENGKEIKKIERNYGWVNDKLLWRKKFTLISKNTGQGNFNGMENLEINVNVEAWGIKINLFVKIADENALNGNKDMVKEKIVQFIEQKIRGVIEPAYKILKKNRKSACLVVLSRNSAHGIGARVLSYLANKGALAEFTEKYIKDKFPDFFEYLRQRFNTTADIALQGFSIRVPMNLEDEILFFRNRQDILLEKIGRVEVCIQNENNLLIDIPNDVYGMHAFFIILENIIRNIEKHTKKDPKDFKLEIELNNYNNDLIEVNIKHKFKGGNFPLENIQNIKNFIEEPVVSSKGKPRVGGWGIMEMKICAAYLRDINLEEIDEPREVPILKAENDGCFTYKIYLLKPKIASMVLGDNIKVEEEIKNKLKSFGLEFVMQEKKKEIFKYGTKSEFLILCGEKVQNKMPQPYVEISESDMKKIKNINNFYEFYAWLYKKYMNQLVEKPSDYCIRIYIKKEEKYDFTFNGENWKREECDNNKNLIIFDSHAYHYNEENYFYYEPYPSTSSTGRIIDKVIGIINNQISDQNSLNILISTLLISAVIPVVIVDERINEIVKRSNYPGIKGEINMKDALKRMRMDIMGELDDLEDYINQNQIQENHVFIVHLGLVEKKAELSDVEDIKRWKDGFEKKVNCKGRLIFISDRGTPPNLPDGSFYLPYESIHYALFFSIGKIKVYKLLQTIRKIRR